MADELLTESWGDTNDAEMCRRILESGMPLSDEDGRLVARLYDEEGTRASVYDLHRLNVLCHQAIGWVKGERRRAELQRDAALGREVREIVGEYDLDMLGASEDVHIEDEGEPDRCRAVVVVSDEQASILSELAEALREEASDDES